MRTGYVELARAQQELWQAAYADNPRLYGTEPSMAARYTARLFDAEGIDDVLELGAGQGRDALFFARQGFSVHATDFSEAALDQLRREARRAGLDDQVTAALHDIRDPLPPADATVGAVYANQVLSMALSRSELRNLVGEVRRVLRPGGLFVYTVPNLGDPRCGAGVPSGDDLYEYDGIAERFFDRELVAELAAGWRLDEIEELTDAPGRRRLWRVVQATILRT